MPKRIQRRRTKGWQMPDGAVYVGRGTAWGNPARIGAWFGEGDPFGARGAFAMKWWVGTSGQIFVRDHAAAVDCFRRICDLSPPRDLHLLRGKDLACWCALDQPCHADVLLELANKANA